tara:strand:- start:323 stop:781 length:459 start_codon:yes stop_codon:yes gene_type:complete
MKQNLSKRPTPKNIKVSEQMRRMPSKDSLPELKIRKALYAKGVRYRIHRKDLPGKPDIAVGPAKVAIFVDGCFWHNCPDHGTVPKNNHQWWVEKFKRNRERDLQKDEDLRERDWLPIHVWEHEDPNEATEKIIKIIRERLSTPNSRPVKLGL